MWKPNQPAQSQTEWVQAAAQLPLAFAQVREDPWIDRAVVSRLPPRPAIMMIASAGCTAAFLCTMDLSEVHLVDLNPAQMALTKLKLRLLQTADSQTRMQVLGHQPLDPQERKAAVTTLLRELDLAEDALGPRELVGEFGPDYVGRYEWVFARLRDEMAPLQGELDALLTLTDTAEQRRRVQPETPLGKQLDTALDRVMDLPNLVALFGPGATANRVQPFSRHFADRIRHVLATMPAATNPYLHQMLRGTFPDAVVYPWLTAERQRTVPSVSWTVHPMTDALRATDGNRYDVVHLSNILDWLPPSQAEETLRLAARVLRPGGIVVIRQLNSRLDIRRLRSDFSWEDDFSAELQAHDRSFFYLQLHVGRKKRVAA